MIFRAIEEYLIATHNTPPEAARRLLSIEYPDFNLTSLRGLLNNKVKVSSDHYIILEDGTTVDSETGEIIDE